MNKFKQKNPKVAVIVGTRPEAIKMAPIVRELGDSDEPYDVSVVATAQNRELLDTVLELLLMWPASAPADWSSRDKLELKLWKNYEAGLVSEYLRDKDRRDVAVLPLIAATPF